MVYRDRENLIPRKSVLLYIILFTVRISMIENRCLLTVVIVDAIDGAFDVGNIGTVPKTKHQFSLAGRRKFY